MYSERQKKLDIEIQKGGDLMDYGMIRKLSFQIMKDSEPRNYVMPSKLNKKI